MNALMAHVQEKMADRPKLARMFEKCLSNTWNTTIKRKADGRTFVITGDIPAMWLRDSTAQVRPYLLLASEDEQIADMIHGLVERQFAYIELDPYANAFNDTANGQGHQEDQTEMNPWIWERKYEIDSLCYPIQLSYLLWKNTGRTSHFNEDFVRGVNKIIDLWKLEQNHESQSNYRFQRVNCPPSDTLDRNGKGTLTAYTGMTWSGFRPSDDACEYGYLIPSNMFAVVVLRYVCEIASLILRDTELEASAKRLADQIDEGIRRFGIMDHPEFGPVYVYETNGLGQFNIMDDANVPSLLSIPYLDYVGADDPVYANTRRLILSSTNPYFYEGKAASGIGSPHTPSRYIWHIALAVQGMTSINEEEQEYLLSLMERTNAGTDFMHEGFHVDDPGEYTRPWFSWANMMFCEFMLMHCGIQVKRG
ncbi:glycoside hydrolase family 125 protein [Paenibacillus wynnii]|uniref:glycoside hydrolase family 125 protein n=1 Tax=Paenibacillus wynnii TaxID=268407 RepID=UPI0027908815|nr:glycoside hydrolase family 125 protein [Paenibacillus wynnii]MDQ0193366.1 meiotically up-regulated gene 157 (Mug157) protein [Paenibacillus wynnii]